MLNHLRMGRTPSTAVALVCLLAAPAAAQQDTGTPPATDGERGFAFGSYGRVQIGTDLRGSTPEPVNVVYKGSRVVEPTYTELDLYYRLSTARGVKMRTVTTIASGDDLFHYTGEFAAKLALRNFYAEAVLPEGIDLWIGSRMYRGDDIYLLDYWPLDDVNTVGGGAGYTRDRLEAAIHVGANRLLDPFQYQQREVLDPEFGSQMIVEMDRQRYVASARATYRLRDPAGGMPGLEVKLYGELQGLPHGTRRREDDTEERLPSDFGWTVGAQLGAWGFAQGRSHANLFARFSQGLTAIDELALPQGFDATRKTFPDASEFLLAMSTNVELGRASVLAGGYLRRFEGANPSPTRADGWEYIADVRPHGQIAGDVEAALDLSYQARFPRALSPTELLAMDPAVFQIAPMILYSPFGRGSYDRPQMRVVYRAARLNDAARDLYAMDDPRRGHAWVHYLGLQAEWWFNSTYR